MDTNMKYKRWGWGAVIGLIAVILIAGLVVALTMSKRPKTAETELANDGANQSIVAVEDNSSNETAKSADEQQQGEDVAQSTESEKSEDSTTKQSANEAENSHNSSANQDKKTAGTTEQNKSNKNSTTQNNSQAAGAANNGTTANASEMPKTGPVDATIAILGAAVSAYLLSLNAVWAKERAAK